MQCTIRQRQCTEDKFLITHTLLTTGISLHLAAAASTLRQARGYLPSVYSLVNAGTRV